LEFRTINSSTYIPEEKDFEITLPNGYIIVEEKIKSESFHQRLFSVKNKDEIVDVAIIV